MWSPYVRRSGDLSGFTAYLLAVVCAYLNSSGPVCTPPRAHVCWRAGTSNGVILFVRACAVGSELAHVLFVPSWA